MREAPSATQGLKIFRFKAITKGMVAMENIAGKPQSVEADRPKQRNHNAWQAG